MKVREFMTTRIEFVDADKSVYDAIEKMVDRRIRSLVVRFSEKDHDYGVITARDVVLKVLSKGNNPNKIEVSEIASKPIICVNQDFDFNEATRMMEKYNIARVFACENGEIVGVLSLLDVMSAALIMRARGEHVT